MLEAKVLKKSNFGANKASRSRGEAILRRLETTLEPQKTDFRGVEHAKPFTMLVFERERRKGGGP